MSIRTLLSVARRPDVVVRVRDVLALHGAKVERLGSVGTFATEVLDVPGRPVPISASGRCASHLPQRGALLAGDAR